MTQFYDSGETFCIQGAPVGMTNMSPLHLALFPHETATRLEEGAAFLEEHRRWRSSQTKPDVFIPTDTPLHALAPLSYCQDLGSEFLPDVDGMFREADKRSCHCSTVEAPADEPSRSISSRLHLVRALLHFGADPQFGFKLPFPRSFEILGSEEVAAGDPDWYDHDENQKDDFFNGGDVLFLAARFAPLHVLWYLLHEAARVIEANVRDRGHLLLSLEHRSSEDSGIITAPPGATPGDEVRERYVQERVARRVNRRDRYGFTPLLRAVARAAADHPDNYAFFSADEESAAEDTARGAALRLTNSGNAAQRMGDTVAAVEMLLDVGAKRTSGDLGAVNYVDRAGKLVKGGGFQGNILHGALRLRHPARWEATPGYGRISAHSGTPQQWGRNGEGDLVEIPADVFQALLKGPINSSRGEEDSDLLTQEDSDGRTPLDLAALQGRADIVDLFLNWPQCDVQAKESRALHALERMISHKLLFPVVDKHERSRCPLRGGWAMTTELGDEDDPENFIGFLVIARILLKHISVEKLAESVVTSALLPLAEEDGATGGLQEALPEDLGLSEAALLPAAALGTQGRTQRELIAALLVRLREV